MGACSELKKSHRNLPVLICFFEIENKIQKDYCLRLKDSLYVSKAIKFEIKANNHSKFSIMLKLNGKMHLIQNIFNEDEIDGCLKKIYDLLDEPYIVNHNNNNNFFCNIEENKENNNNSFFCNIEENEAKEMKKKVLENQQKLRDNEQNIKNIYLGEIHSVNIISDDILGKEKNEQINNVLEDMCIYGTITKKEIREEKKKYPEKFIETSQALKMENEDEGLFALGLLANNLEQLGIEAVIEKDSNKNEDNSDLTFVQFLSNGMINKKKYDLHFEFGEQRNNELLNNKNEYEKFKENLKLKLSKDYNIPPEKIIVTLPQKGSFHVQVIFQSEEFNNLNKKQFIDKFKNDPEFGELSNLKDIHEEIIMGGFKLTPNILDPEGNRNTGWAIGEQRGGKDYDPPLGWIGIGLKVKGNFDKGDDTWIGMNNSPGEWCVAYHGVGSAQNSDKVKLFTHKIIKDGFKPGERQAHSECMDQFHPGKKVGNGVYCTPSIKTAENFAGKSNINGVDFKIVLMVRVKPNKIRHCDSCSDSRAPYNYWVVNGTTDEIRPYRILYKKD